MTLAVCWKWVSSSDGADDARWAGVSPADEAALELALELEPVHGSVTVVCVGPRGADTVLRDALAAGATRAVRIDSDVDADSRDVANALATVVGDADFVLCGDYSRDRGTGSVPAFLAHELGIAQALGLVELDTQVGPGDATRPRRGLRRLDGGRREVLDITAPAVISVEGSVRRLRRASLSAAVRAKSADIETVLPSSPTLDTAATHHVPALVTPYRPRARSLPAPAGSVLTRVREILDVGGVEESNSETVTLEPADAAARILDQLERWGHLTALPGSEQRA
jgi:electron transfer flavoprotein beta subunit